MFKRALISTLTVLLLIGINCRPSKEDTNTSVTTQGLKVSVQKVVAGTIENCLTVPSTIDPWEEVTVFPKIPGKLVKKVAKEGQNVTKDDVIALVNRDEIGQVNEDYGVTATIAGVVAKIMLDEGSTVTPATPIAVIVNLDNVKTMANVIEFEIGEIQLGMRAAVIVPAYPYHTFSGFVSNILPLVDPISHTAKVEIKIANPNHQLKPGMSANITICLGKHDNAVIIPKSAVIEKMGEKYVFLYADGVAKRSDIETDYDDGTNLEVTKGVNDGDFIVTSDLNVLVDGTKIQMREEK
jgi:multidrug efflux pump subunit AcrA (membrane-fusion protein)